MQKVGCLLGVACSVGLAACGGGAGDSSATNANSAESKIEARILAGTTSSTQMVNGATASATSGANSTSEQTPPTTNPGAAPTTTSSGTLPAPVVSTTPVASNVVRIQNNQGPAQPARLITFGYVFPKASLPNGTMLAASINGVAVPLQVDVKATHSDGSVRHAVLTLRVPALAEGASVDTQLSVSAGTSSGAPVNIATVLAAANYKAALNMVMHNATGSETPLSFDIVKLTTAALSSGTTQRWLSGPLVSEVRVDTPINTWMHTRFDVRAYADGSIQTDVIVLNDSIAMGETTFAYDVTLTQNGTTAYSLTNIQQIRSTTWHREMASIPDPKYNIVRNMSDLAATGAIPNYDFSVAMNTGAGSTLQSDYQSLQGADADTGHMLTDPMGSAGITKYMPQTGGRPDIGTTPGWTSRYLDMQNDMAAFNMYARADAAGSVPWHYTDPLTGLPVMRDANHPQLWLDSRYFGSDTSQEKTITSAQWSSLFSQPLDNWTPQVAHQPNLSYVPYLLTGRHYYLDEMEFQAAMNVASTNCFYGCAVSVNEEIRGEAWGLREIANAAYLVPDADPMKAYFNSQLDLNMNALVTAHDNDFSHGQLYGAFAGNPNVTAPWQEGFFLTVLSMISQRGDTRANSVMQWMGNFVAGLYTNGNNGFNPFFGPAYWPAINNQTTNVPLTTWANFFTYNLSQGNFGTVTSATGAVTSPSPTSTTFFAGYPGQSGQGYVAIARGANGSYITATQNPMAIEAFGFIVGHNFGASDSTTLTTDSTVFLDDNGFDQNPRLKDGQILMARNILAPGYMALNANGQPLKYGNDSCTTAVLTTGRNEDELIHGDDVCNNFTIQGGNGIDLLFAGNGNNVTVNGGSNDDYLFGGAGADTLYAAAGTNYIKGGSGKMTFVFIATDVAHDTVVNFKAGDILQISGISTTPAAIIAGATIATDGSAVLHLGAHDITLEGTSLVQISTAQIVLK
jgi:hypothetical protein